MLRGILLSAVALAAAIVLVGGQPAASHDFDEDDHDAYEVWLVDQSDTTPEGGGTLYVYDDEDLTARRAARAVPKVTDLGGAAQRTCLAQTGSAPRRPHMMLFNDDETHLVLAYVATGHVLFMNAETRAPITCIDVGAQAHAAFPAPDDSYVVVANQNGKLLQRIRTDYTTNTFTLDSAATLDLAACVTPSGAPCQDPALRPDNAPICPIIDNTSRFTFVTLRGGGLFVVDSRATPMRIVAEYDSATVHPNGCGGIENKGRMYLNAGGGTPANPLQSDLYAFRLWDFSTTPNPPNSPTPKLVFSQNDQNFVDSLGAALTRGGRFLWVADRAANHIAVVDTRHDRLAGEIELTGPLSADPAPDLVAVAPSGQKAFVSLRGPNPLTANVPGTDNAVGRTPGLGVLRVEGGGKRGTLRAIAPISHVVDGKETADPHGLAIRRRSP
jgi:DNA-binding beta-propeller fold protein YncE